MNPLFSLRPYRAAGLVIVPALLMAACASSVPPPDARIAVATAAIAHAAAAGGTEYAPAEMRMARDKLQRATVAITARDNANADVLAEQSQLDALLAEAKAESAKASKAATALQDGSRVLKEELDRKAQ
jgi:Domain of unknown function (DUF4398)